MGFDFVFWHFAHFAGLGAGYWHFYLPKHLAFLFSGSVFQLVVTAGVADLFSTLHAEVVESVSEPAASWSVSYFHIVLFLPWPNKSVQPMPVGALMLIRQPLVRHG